MKGRIYQNGGGFVVRFGRDVSKYFKTLEQAERFLTGLRYETDQGKFDPRDYQSDRPLSVRVLVLKYLKNKEQTVKRRTFTGIERYLGKAVDAWGDRNIKSIQYGDIEDLISEQPFSSKTKSNMTSALHDFFVWVKRRRDLDTLPEFPQVKFELGWRNIVDVRTQQAIIAEVDRITHHINPKIGIGIRWLSIYVSIRPGELLNILEGHIDRSAGMIVIPHPKEKKPKLVPLLDEDLAILDTFPRGLPHLHFFRHGEGASGGLAGTRFGPQHLLKWWKRACDNLGITGVDLYGGTRHSTATAMGQIMTPEQVKTATMHSTNRAFERYLQRQVETVKSVYQQTADLQRTYTQNDRDKSGNVLKIKGLSGGGGGSSTR